MRRNSTFHFCISF